MTKDFTFTSELKAKEAVQTCFGLQSWATLERAANKTYIVTCSDILSDVIEFRYKNYIK